MIDSQLLDEVGKKHDDSWWPLRQMEGVLAAAQTLPCFQGNDELSMESFEHLDPIIELCLQKVKEILSKHEEVTSQLSKLRCLERDSKPGVSDGIELLKQYSEHLKLPAKDEIWAVNLEMIINQIDRFLSSSSEHSEDILFFKKLIDENQIRKTA